MARDTLDRMITLLVGGCALVLSGCILSLLNARLLTGVPWSPETAEHAATIMPHHMRGWPNRLHSP